MKTERFFLRVEEFDVEIRTDVPEYARLVRFYLPAHVRAKPVSSPAMRLDVRRRRPVVSEEPWGGDFDFLSELWRYGLAWRADVPARRATVAVDDRKRVPPGLLYHGGLLFPFSLLAQPRRAALIHGAVVSDGKRATLLTGASGAGKSTLSVSFNFAGAFCFTDEHAMIRGGRGGVFGARFLSRVALPAVSMRNFKDRRNRFSWEPRVGKYFLKPAAHNRPAASCRIDKIIFPRFTLSGRTRIRRLERPEVLRRLLLDDYYYHSCHHPGSSGRRHRDLLTELAGSAAGYSVLYGPADVRHLPERIGELP
ncbi:MAG TPA: hypothetical protein VL404_07080 [Candidatus Eisenbacteria bacterium]|nr:hypothetical protein [Candidatus Eisenbacteria bacterium]